MEGRYGRERWALVALLVASACACFNVGMILLTHVSYGLWRAVGVEEMDAVHALWSSSVDWVIHPLSIASAVGTVGLIVVRHRLVPWWLVGAASAVQVSIFMTTLFMWSVWQHELGESGLVRMPDGSLNPAYERVMDTHWIRIALVCGYAVLVLVMLGVAVLFRAPRRSAGRAVLG